MNLPTELKWYYRFPWTRVMMFIYCVGCFFVGLIGVSGEPAPTMEQELGFYAVLLYSWILMGAGLLGAIGIFRNVQATVIAVWAIAAATFFHGAATLTGGSYQTGLRLIIAPIMMIPLVWVWRDWLLNVQHVSNLQFPKMPWQHH